MRLTVYGSKNETKMFGMWTGERWWSTKAEIKSGQMELEVRKKKI
jgi:hypothetical protein